MHAFVVLECDIPELPTGSFYRELLHVLVKDTVLQPSSPARNAAELTALLTAAAHMKPIKKYGSTSYIKKYGSTS